MSLVETSHPPDEAPTTPARGDAGAPEPPWRRTLAAVRSGELLGPVDLSGAHLVGEDLSGLTLVRANLAGANLSNADLSGAVLLGANLEEAVLFGARLDDVELAAANLAGANLDTATGAGVGFGGATLRGATLMQAELPGSSLTKADLRAADLRSATLPGARLLEADLTGADLTGADLRGADLASAQVSGARLDRVDLRGASLRGMRGFDRASWIGADLRDINFAGAYLVRRFVMDQNYLHEFRHRSRWSGAAYQLWWLTSDCGRSLTRWSLCVAALVLAFAGLYAMVDVDYGAHETPLSAVYYSVVTLTTLGYGDVLPASVGAQLVAMAEVFAGYVMLGGLLSIFSNKMARRAE